MDWSREEEHQAFPRQQSPDRRAPEEYSHVTQKRLRSREEEYTKVARRRESPRKAGPEKERDVRTRGWRGNRPQNRSADHPRNLRDDHHHEGIADNHHKTVHGTGGKETHRQKRRRRGMPRRPRSTPRKEQQRRATVRGISGSSSHAHTVDGSTSTLAS